MSWLWKGDVTSPAAFEKALSKLSAQITAANLALDVSRSRGRRAKALWTLYTTLTYLLYTLVLVLVLGPQNWALPHYGGLLGAPLIIYTVRKAITVFFDWRTSRQQAYIDYLQKQRDEKIAELKKATKYDSTQELLQKYGGSPAKKTATKEPQQGTKRKIAAPQEQKQLPQRTGIAPPPTANIPGRNTPNPPPAAPIVETGANRGQHAPSPIIASQVSQSPSQWSPDAVGFAPNAFPSAPPPAPAYDQGPHWYDRILDIMLGEDETAAKNRIVLLCSNCRLVNGQAPPGVRTLEEVGKWRCSSCGGWNGIENEGTKVVKEIVQRAQAEGSDDWEKVPKASVAEASVPEEEPEDSEFAPAEDGATGIEEEDSSGMTRRVTRSAGRKQSFESLE